MDFSLSTTAFPDSTTVYAKPVDYKDEPIAATASSNVVAFTGLRPGEKYIAYGVVSGSRAEVRFTTTADTSHLVVAERTFTETAGAGTYTASVSVPAGATVHDIIVNGVALWNNAGACTLKVGDVADDDGFYTGVDLKATDLLAGESLSFSQAGGKAGAYIANSQVSPRYSASARVISGIVTTASTGGTTGRTRMTVLYSAPAAADIAAATKA